MIRKSILSGFILLGVYTALILHFGPQIHRTAQTVAQRNLVKAEEYLYEDYQLADTVILGSSMSERILFSAHCINLAMPGLSAHEGLELVLMSRRLPKVALVEINLLGHPLDMSSLKSATDPTQRTLKRYIPFMRQKYQPIGVLKAVLRDLRSGGSNFVTPEAATVIDTALREKTVKGHLLAAGESLPYTKTNHSLSAVWNKLMALHKRGVKLIFYEAPVDYRLQDTPANRLVRTFIQQRFPTSEFSFITLPASHFETTDGIHLTVSDMPRFSNHLRQGLQAIQTTATILASSKKEDTRQ